ncbi:pyrimidodiazepine synthase-like [Varroa destructor]|uniref:Glutathione transferase n=1 Tax=Varroa destructor TaxID=109461 RepID=A0A7M7JNI0_VARDE|nr:pyrimidodiazepine synthase-like [Varroa destructor]XP_022654855.1 pyrimidodiazepine synthase-like [Varroa destructor]
MTPPATAFAAGSTEPSRAAGQLRIYSMRFCPFASRSLLVLLAKEIPHEVVNINLASKPEWYLGKSPSGKVPLLENDGVLLPESMVISEYLDETCSGRKLLPQDPYKKALDKVFLESFVFSPIFKVYFNKEQYAEGFDAFWSNAAVVEDELKKRGMKFLGGNDKPGFTDLMIWPFFQIAIGLTTLYADLKIPREKYPLIASWIDSMSSTPEVMKLVNQDHLAEYMRLKIAGNANYDLGL